jgi:hypothetical protein
MTKKHGYLITIGVFFMGMLIAGCAPMQKTYLTDIDVSVLKGTWSGWTTFSSYQAQHFTTTLEISSTTVPIAGKMILHNFPGPVRKAMGIPLENVMADNSIILYFNNAEITGKGTLIGRNGQDYLELTYYSEKQRLQGPFYFYGATGEVSVSKK